MEPDALGPERFRERGGHVWLHRWQQPRPANHSDIAPHATHHLSELCADISAADDDHASWQILEVQQRCAGQIVDLLDARYRRHGGPDRMSTRLTSSHLLASRMLSSSC